MPATPVWLAAVEAVLNRSLAAQARARALVRRLDGKSLQIDAADLTRIRATAVGGRLALRRGEDSDADAVISGSPTALLQLLTGGVQRPAERAPARIRGDAEVAGLYRELLALLRPDWEEELSRVVGDLPARRIGRLARQSLEWLRRARRSLREDIAEYLQEESRDLVNRTELDEYLQGVDELREAADRLEARCERLEQRRPGNA